MKNEASVAENDIPYGFRVDVRGNLCQNEYEQKTTKLIVKLIADGFNYREIIEKLNKGGYFFRCDGWDENIIKEILNTANRARVPNKEYIINAVRVRV